MIIAGYSLLGLVTNSTFKQANVNQYPAGVLWVKITKLIGVYVILKPLNDKNRQ